MSPEEIAYAEYQRKQQAIHDELDTRTGRLWTESWTITDDEWMADETWEDIEEWKPSLATRKSLESVHVYNINTTSSATNHDGGVKGVPTLSVLSTLALPTTLPPHPGHGTPTIHATHRKKTIMRQLRTSIQIVIHDDILKIMNDMSTYNERQAAVDVLYETIHDKVREREPVLCKLPNFAQLVDEGLEDVLSMVQESMTRQAKVEKKTKKMKGMMMKTTELDNQKDIATTTTTTTNGLKSIPAGGKDIQKQPIVIDENIIDVMGVNIEPPIPIFMDILAATRHLHTLQQEYKQYDNKSNSATGTSSPPSSSDVAASTPPPPPRILPPPTTNTFFATTNDVNVPNLLYPLTNHPKMGVGRMVEEWQLAANKETKRIMIRDAMKEISSIVVNATTVTTTKEVVTQQQPFSSSDDDDDVVVDSTTSTEVMTTTTTTAGGGGGGATRILVTGKRGVGKVRDRCQTSLILPILLLYCCCFTLHIQLIGTHTYYYRLPPLLGLLHLLVSLVILLFTIPMVIDCVNMGTTLNHVPIVQDCTIYLKLPRNFVTNY
jgi:small subunit ribosomal protein S29